MTESTYRDYLTEDEFRMVYNYKKTPKKTLADRIKEYFVAINWAHRSKIIFLSLPRSLSGYTWTYAANDVISGLIL